ncbi:Dsl1-C domain-containing protein [Mycena chlorophos]|uniref:Dsl1-C domain-containing protein n=1 Tax=Mycena chlorophos TaxID=658473 RepID=A0A8H6T2W6_MYCCL|nr:Dsl1-C domain-containing protein [Mycena chlorophos]
MAFPVPDHLPRRQSPKDVSSDILMKIDSATNQTLSAELAASWLGELDGTIHSTKQQIHDRIHRDLPLFEQQLETSKSVQTRLQTLSGHVNDLDHTLSDSETGLIPTLVRSLTAHAALAQQATDAALRHESVLYLLRCRKAFTGVLSMVQLGKLPEAVVACGGFEQEHLSAVPVHLEQTTVFSDLKRKFQAAKSRTEEQLSEAYSRSVVVSAQSAVIAKSVVVRQSETVISLSEILSSLTPTARATLLSTLRRDLTAYYVDQLLQQPASLSLSSEHGEERLTVIPSPPAENNPTARLENVAAALKFFTTHFAASLPESDRPGLLRGLCKPVGSSVLANLLIAALPTAFAGLPAFLTLAQRAVAFEDEYVVVLLGGDAHDRPIKTWVDGLGGHYERRRRMLILDEARVVVLAPEGQERFVVEIDPFAGEKKAVLPNLVPVQEGNGQVDEWGFDDDDDAGEDDAWGFGEEAKAQAPTVEVSAEEADDSWGFDDEKAPATNGAAVEEDAWGLDEDPTPETNGHKPEAELQEDGDAWGLDDESSNDTAWEDDPWNDPPENPAVEEPPLKAPVLASPAPAASPRMATRLEKLANKGKKHLNGNSPLASPVPVTSTPPPPPPPQPTVVAPPLEVKPPAKRPPELTTPLVANVPKETYWVTSRMKQIIAIVEEVLAEGKQFAASKVVPASASNSSAEPGTVMLQSAVSVVDLYRALYPVQFAGRLKTAADAPMQLSNDCLYLSEEMGRVERAFVGPLAVKERLGECRERLRVWGESWFQDTIDQYRNSVDETIAKGAEGFTFLADQDRYDDCEAAIGRAVQEIKRLAQRWQGVLNKSKYYTAVGLITDAALSRLLVDVLALPDITEVESHRLHELFRMLSALEALFVEDVNQQPFVVAYVPSWLKFSYLTELMDASMVDIVDLFESGALVDFEVDELVRLVRALFADNALRTNTINKLTGGHAR